MTQHETKSDTARDDDVLIHLVAEGDKAAFESLYTKYRAPLVGFFVKKTGNRDLAEDLAQDTLFKMLRSAASYKSQGRFAGWLYCIARNMLTDLRRHHKVDATGSATTGQLCDAAAAIDFARDVEESPVDQAIRHENASVLRSLIAELPEAVSRTVQMHYYDDQPVLDVATATNVPEATCKGRLRIARGLLRNKAVLQVLAGQST